MRSKSYGRIYMREGGLGMHLVNAYRQQYFLHVRPLMAMVKRPEEYARVRVRNSNEKPVIGCPAGDVWGLFEPYDDEVEITLVIGPRDQEIEMNLEVQEPENVVAGQTYILPSRDFETLYLALELMVRQEKTFQELLDDAETSIEL